MSKHTVAKRGVRIPEWLALVRSELESGMAQLQAQGELSSQAVLFVPVQVEVELLVETELNDNKEGQLTVFVSTAKYSSSGKDKNAHRLKITFNIEGPIKLGHRTANPKLGERQA